MKHDLYKLADQYHLNANEQQLLQAVLETAKNGGQCSVREFAAQNYTSPAAVIRLSKKMGYTGYTDMIYRIGFLIQNEIDNKNHASDITAFIGGIPEEKIHILKPVQDSFAQHRSIIAFVGADNSPIARCADPAFVLLDDKMLDDRNLTANYFYARVLITFEYLMDLVLEKDEHPNGKEG